MMSDVVIEILSEANFNRYDIDDFIRTQLVTDVYRKVDGDYVLVRQPFIDDWTPERKREKAISILGDGYITCGAFQDKKLVGFLMLEKKLRQNRMVVDSFHVSRDYRHHGIGRLLFCWAVKEGTKRGAQQLYISACSSKETIGFYKAMGCKLADPVIRELADDEPYDLQLVFDL